MLWLGYASSMHFTGISTKKPEIGRSGFFSVNKHMPTTVQADAYQALVHYLRSIQTAKTFESEAVMKTMKSLPLDDSSGSTGYVRADGRVIRDLYLFEIKKPSQSRYQWDDYSVVSKIPLDTGYIAPSKSECRLLRSTQ